ncbi:hypothetical protein [Olleya sp. HaHaR_3_96]|uniref:hypothetical protein n=1 Tax=Olleya sp. HaHaR_3_96 TaxID=2745560 RepID=UPI001C4E4605|nr:hypothetical protein [Olleya sp. HaHaR_3_96]QXP58409.1 hypothetical protein H0I26_10805 [Olleya sp. HaHaR_3_96]
MSKIPTIFFLSVLFLCISCNSNKKKTIEEYKTYNLQQQGWKTKRINQFIGDINYTATQVPLQYYLLKNIGKDMERMDSIYKANNKERIIEIEFQHTNQDDLLKEKYTNRSYEDAVKYMAFTIANDFTVITSSNDTILCSGVNFERNFKVAPFKRALLYFNNINPDQTIKLIYQDKLFDNGIIKFNFGETPIKI